MKIAIDYSPVTVNRAGIGYLTIEIANALLSVDKENQYVIFTDSTEIAFENPDFRYLPRPTGTASGTRWMRQLAKIAKRENFDFIISTSSLTFPLFSSRVIQFVNDLAPITYPQAFSFKQRLIYSLGLRITAARAVRIFFISNTTQKSFNSKFHSKSPQDFSLLGLNEFVNFTLNKVDEYEVAQTLRLPEKYFASVSTLEPRKNYENMIRAFALFSKTHPDYYYLIGGKTGWMYEPLFQLIKDLDLEDKVRFLGFVSDAQKHYLVKNALGFLYLSHDEGFGLPNIEAYALEVPVLTSDIPIMREVMQDQSLYADPNDVDDIADKLVQLLQTRRTKDAKFLARFDWETTARKLISLYKAD